jgi:DNA-directed RNA polymerase alpha subunit
MRISKSIPDLSWYEFDIKLYEGKRKQLIEKLAAAEEIRAEAKKALEELNNDIKNHEHASRYEPRYIRWDDPRLSLPISVLDLSNRTRNIIVGEQGMTVIQQVVLTREIDFIKMRRFGRRCMADLKRELRKIGLCVGMTKLGYDQARV